MFSFALFRLTHPTYPWLIVSREGGTLVIEQRPAVDANGGYSQTEYGHWWIPLAFSYQNRAFSFDNWVWIDPRVQGMIC